MRNVNDKWQNDKYQNIKVEEKRVDALYYRTRGYLKSGILPKSVHCFQTINFQISEKNNYSETRLIEGYFKQLLV